MIMRGIKALWFDLDDTLFDHTYSVCRGLDAIRQRYPAFGEYPSDQLAVLYNRALNHVYGDYLRGEFDLHEMRRRKLKLFYAAAQVVESNVPTLDEFHRIYDEAYRIHRRATPGSIELLKRFADDGIPMAILTNGHQAGQKDKLRTIRMEWMVPHLLTSEQAGAPKPDSYIYEWALEQTGQAPENVLMVGDSLENDVEAALRCRLSAVQYDPGATQATVSTIYGVAPIIREWDGLLELVSNARALGATR
jgi:putative hydrolase of the HAD superfamily